MRKLAVTQTPVKDYQLPCDVKNSQGVNNNDNLHKIAGKDKPASVDRFYQDICQKSKK